MRTIEQKIREVDSTMAMEGMPLTAEDKQRLRDILTGKTNADTVVKELVRYYSAKGKAKNDPIRV